MCTKSKNWQFTYYSISDVLKGYFIGLGYLTVLVHCDIRHSKLPDHIHLSNQWHPVTILPHPICQIFHPCSYSPICRPFVVFDKSMQLFLLYCIKQISLIWLTGNVQWNLKDFVPLVEFRTSIQPVLRKNIFRKAK